MNTIAIIQARMGSSRLPGKVMRTLLGKPVLWHVINRVSKAKLIDDLIVATTSKHEDDVIEQFCKDNDILFFRGAENDVLDRFYQCARKYNIKHIVRLTADCPLHDPTVIDLIVNKYQEGDYDYVSNTIEYSFPDGLDVEIFSFSALNESWENAKLPSEREHVTPYIKKNENFKKENVYSKKKYSLYRLTLDYPEDYQFIKKIYEGIGKDLFYLDTIDIFLKNNQVLLEINQNFKFNEGYARSLQEDALYTEKRSSDEEPVIKGRMIYLRKLEEEDASQEYCNWLNNPLVNKFLMTKKTTVEELKQYIKKRKSNKNCLFMGIFLNDTKEHIGNVKLEPINFENKKATLGILIGNKNYWGRGIGTESVKLLVEYAFKNLKLNNINLAVIAENKAAIRCYKKVGFKIDEIKRRTKKVQNKHHNKIIMSIKRVQV